MAKSSTNASTKSQAASKSRKPRGKAKTGSATTPSNGAASIQEVSPEDRNRMIQYAAYHLAEQDGFQPGREQDYWLRAERQIDELLKGQQALAHTGEAGADIH